MRFTPLFHMQDCVASRRGAHAALQSYCNVLIALLELSSIRRRGCAILVRPGQQSSIGITTHPKSSTRSAGWWREHTRTTSGPFNGHCVAVNSAVGHDLNYLSRYRVFRPHFLLLGIPEGWVFDACLVTRKLVSECDWRAIQLEGH